MSVIDENHLRRLEDAHLRLAQKALFRRDEDRYVHHIKRALRFRQRADALQTEQRPGGASA